MAESQEMLTFALSLKFHCKMKLFEFTQRFSDEMKGWALVKVMDDRCSRQTIVTRCTLYQRYMTEDALEVASDSYGGLTDTPFL